MKNAALSFLILLVFSITANADEGMWTFDNPPVKQLKERYDFVPTQEWLDHVRLSSVRFNDGGSGSFVSPNGLVLTNHHVARGQLQKLSSSEANYVFDGYYAKSMEQELKATDLELNVLVSMENVTARINKSVKKNMSDQEALEARKAEMALIEKESLKKTSLRSDVITLYQGGEYWLYRYKKYTDVRIVFAPEMQAAYYGGDLDNFTYPRYDLDMAIVRVYENGKPVDSKNYLKWNTKGAGDGDLVFVPGNPGSTNRLQTVAQLERQRDYSYPFRMELIKRRMEVLKIYSALGPEQARQAAGQIFGLSNAIKAWTGEYNGLLDESLMKKKNKDEEEFKALVNSKPEWKKEYGSAWDEISAAENTMVGLLKPLRYRSVSGSRMFALAETIVKYAAEINKPDGERLEGFHDSQLESSLFYLLSPAPVYPELEKMMIADGLRESLENLGEEDPFIKTVLNGKSPEAVAAGLLDETRIADPAFRKSLIDGGKEAVESSDDPLIVLARKLDPMSRALDKEKEDKVESVEAAAEQKLGRARFAVYGKSVNPDANFTLRLSYGKVEGYEMNGTMAPPKTTLYGLYDRANSFDFQPPFNLPKRFLERKDKLDLSAPANFVNSCDIIGGNSGSPVINQKAELVGLIFDGNIESLVGRYVYYESNNRSVAVHSSYMIEALRKLYDASALADELEGKKEL
ncbi:MAG: S46 family peptidase [Calditrichaceae bacterium]